MIKERKKNLEEAIEKEWQKGIVKNAWLDYEKSYKYIRNPSDAQTQEYHICFFYLMLI